MKISSALLKPNLLEIENGFVRLAALLSGQHSEEAEDLKSYIGRQLGQVQKSKSILFALENDAPSLLSYEYFEEFRKMKLRLRFAERRWRLILSNQARSRKMRERNEHVASVAA